MVKRLQEIASTASLCHIVTEYPNAMKELSTFDAQSLKIKVKRGSLTLALSMALSSLILCTWLSMKLCPPNPGFTDMIRIRSTTARQDYRSGGDFSHQAALLEQHATKALHRRCLQAPFLMDPW